MVIIDENKNKKEKKSMTVAEAGKKGGEATKKKHGHEYYVRIGKKGGNRIKELVGKAKREREKDD